MKIHQKFIQSPYFSELAKGIMFEKRIENINLVYHLKKKLKEAKNERSELIAITSQAQNEDLQKVNELINTLEQNLLQLGFTVVDNKIIPIKQKSKN